MALAHLGLKIVPQTGGGDALGKVQSTLDAATEVVGGVNTALTSIDRMFMMPKAPSSAPVISLADIDSLLKQSAATAGSVNSALTAGNGFLDKVGLMAMMANQSGGTGISVGETAVSVRDAAIAVDGALTRGSTLLDLLAMKMKS